MKFTDENFNAAIQQREAYIHTLYYAMLAPMLGKDVAALRVGEIRGFADDLYPQPAAAKDLAALRPRIVAAIERIVSGHGCMRVPAEETDPDLVLADVLSIIDQQAKPEVGNG
ncbi:hypothetical protein [Xanthomonas arboricola]|uniref:hypothetical protein n=1 Tax=Xanthomonas arboricola TaxID=56448 RepID=UPI00141B2C34|nr:hypothetical protein [Xanthomonas arboricola]NIK50311.1 hypothetical protein [Xanthomonas arboricola]